MSSNPSTKPQKQPKTPTSAEDIRHARTQEREAADLKAATRVIKVQGGTIPRHSFPFPEPEAIAPAPAPEPEKKPEGETEKKPEDESTGNAGNGGVNPPVTPESSNPPPTDPAPAENAPPVP